MDFQDRPLQCTDCKNEFVFTAGEQEFYERKGFRELPKRCKPCRDMRKQRRGRDGGNEYGNDQGGYEARRPREPREMFDAVCAQCGAAAQVPFQPTSGRPVYCRDCFQGQRSNYGGGY